MRHFSSHSNTRRSTVSGDTATRLITIRGYNYQDESEITEVSLSVRLPEDIKRERVKFTLTGLDLL